MCRYLITVFIAVGLVAQPVMASIPSKLMDISDSHNKVMGDTPSHHDEDNEGGLMHHHSVSTDMKKASCHQQGIFDQTNSKPCDFNCENTLHCLSTCVTTTAWAAVHQVSKLPSNLCKLPLLATHIKTLNSGPPSLIYHPPKYA